MRQVIWHSPNQQKRPSTGRNPDSDSATSTLPFAPRLPVKVIWVALAAWQVQFQCSHKMPIQKSDKIHESGSNCGSRDTEMEVGEMLIPPSAARKLAANTHTATPWFSASGGDDSGSSHNFSGLIHPKWCKFVLTLDIHTLDCLLLQPFPPGDPGHEMYCIPKLLRSGVCNQQRFRWLAACQPWAGHGFEHHFLQKSDLIQTRQFKLTIHPKWFQQVSPASCYFRHNVKNRLHRWKQNTPKINKKSSFHGVTIQFHPNFLASS